MGGVAGDLRNSAVGQIGIVLGLCAHGGCSSFINIFAERFASTPVHPKDATWEKQKKSASTAKTVETIVFLFLLATDTDLTLTLIVPVLEALM